MRYFLACGESGAEKKFLSAMSDQDPVFAGIFRGVLEKGDVFVSFLRSVPPVTGPDLSVAAVLKRESSGYVSSGEVFQDRIFTSVPFAAEYLRILFPESEISVLTPDECAGMTDKGTVIVPESEVSGFKGKALDPDLILPAPGQGSVSVICRKDDRETAELCRKINHNPSRIETGAERGIARLSGLHDNLGIRAETEDMFLHVRALSISGSGIREADEYIPPDYVMDDLLGIAEYLSWKRDYIVRGAVL